MNPTVKQERPDEAEIQELATKMIATYRSKVQLTEKGIQTNRQTENMYLLNFLSQNLKTENNASASSVKESNTLGDEESICGRFGWVGLGKENIPYIIRNREKYCAVRMVEIHVLNKYLTYLHQDICNCTCIRSYYITEAECKLFNEINIKHCDLQFGCELFSCRDLVVRLTDAIEFHLFLDAVYTKLLTGVCSGVDRCGFIRIHNESVVPYTIYKSQKYVPLFYFEGETDNLKQKAERLEGWDLAYLKFCCKVQGIRNELFEYDHCTVIGLSDVRNYFPAGTMFEDYWPHKVADSQLLINGRTRPPASQWARQPLGAPPHPMAGFPLPVPNATIIPKGSTEQIVSAMYSTYRLPGGATPYPVLQQRGTNTAIRGSSSFFASPNAPPPMRPVFFIPPGATTSPAIRPQPGYKRHQLGRPFDFLKSASGKHRSKSGRPHLPHIMPKPPPEEPVQPKEENTNTSNESQSEEVVVEKKYVSLIDIPTSGRIIPYKMHKAFIETRMVPCINMKPYIYTELLVTLSDLIDELFKDVPLQSCQQVMQLLGIELYKGNKSQMEILFQNGKCKSVNDCVPLVPVRLVLEYMPQLKYMLGGLMRSDTSNQPSTS